MCVYQMEGVDFKNGISRKILKLEGALFGIRLNTDISVYTL